MVSRFRKALFGNWRSRLGLILCAGVVLFWLALPPKVPIYESRTLEYWVKELPLTVPTKSPNGFGYVEMNSMTVDTFTFGALEREETKHAIKAFREIGTNALPFLLGEVQQTDGWGKRVARTIFKKLNRSTPRLFQPAKPRQYQALTAMRLLGTNIAVYRPQLEKLAKISNEDIRSAAWLLLQGLSTNAPRRWARPPLLVEFEVE